jgi:hypothetical protein
MNEDKKRLEEIKKKYNYQPESTASVSSGATSSTWYQAAKQKYANASEYNKTEAPKKNIAGRFFDKVKEFSTGIAKGELDTVISTAKTAQEVGQGIIAAFDPRRDFSQVREQTGFESLKGKKIEDIEEMLKAQGDAEKAGKFTEFIAELVWPVGKAKEVQTVITKGKDVVETGIEKGKELIEPGIAKTKELVETGINKTKEAVTPQITPENAVKQIAQGETDDFASAQSALETIDTTGVKTYSELQKNIKYTIPKFARQVDFELSKDTGVYKLKDLATTATTKGGKEVVTNYVEKALKDLSEAYENIGDMVSKGNIDELIKRAKKTGLTRKEVNDISRMYGSEFKNKAFKANGDPLTSVNAQAFENTRKGLKEVARQGLGGEKAEMLDSKLSDMFNLEKLVDKNVEAVNKARQKLKELSLLGKLTSRGVDIMNTLSGGSLKAFFNRFSPASFDDFEKLDIMGIEKELRKNLDVLERANREKNSEAMLNILEKNLMTE